MSERRSFLPEMKRRGFLRLAVCGVAWVSGAAELPDLSLTTKVFPQAEATPSPEPALPLPSEKLTPDEFLVFAGSLPFNVAVESLALPSLDNLYVRLFKNQGLSQIEDSDFEALFFFELHRRLYEEACGPLPPLEANGSLSQYYGSLSSDCFQGIYEGMMGVLTGEVKVEGAPNIADLMDLLEKSPAPSDEEVEARIKESLDYLEESSYLWLKNAGLGLKTLLQEQIPEGLNPDLFEIRPEWGFRIYPVKTWQSESGPFVLRTHTWPEVKRENDQESYVWRLGWMEIGSVGVLLTKEALALALAKEFYNFYADQFIAQHYLVQQATSSSGEGRGLESEFCRFFPLVTSSASQIV